MESRDDDLSFSWMQCEEQRPLRRCPVPRCLMIWWRFPPETIDDIYDPGNDGDEISRFFRFDDDVDSTD